MINLDNLEEALKEEKRFQFECSREVAEHLINFLKRNHYLTSYDEQFAKEYLMAYLREYFKGEYDDRN